MGDSAELRYASDLRLCPLIRQQRKAGVLSLDDIVKGKNKRELFLHYTRLAKEYNDRKMIEEATLVSQFWAETSSAFEGDDAGLYVYLTAWTRTYSGRAAFPSCWTPTSFYVTASTWMEVPRALR